MGRVGGHLLRGREVSRPIRLQNVVVQGEKMLELFALGIGRIARQSEQGDRSRLVLQLDVVDLEPGEFRRFVPRGGAGDGVDAELLGRPFEPRGDVDFVAQRRIIEPLDRPHVADAAFAGVSSDSELDLTEGAPPFSARSFHSMLRWASVLRISSAARTPWIPWAGSSAGRSKRP